MFNAISHWGWVAFAWLELAIAYGGYLLYLNWRAKRLKDKDDA
jgi:hypothetical protein